MATYMFWTLLGVILLILAGLVLIVVALWRQAIEQGRTTAALQRIADHLGSQPGQEAPGVIKE